MKQTWDKKGIPIQHGDLLKTYHFTIGRRHQYLYHVVQLRGDHLEAVPCTFWLPGEAKNGGSLWLIGEQGFSEVIHGFPHNDSKGVLRCHWERRRVRHGQET